MVKSKTRDEHVFHLQEVFHLLRKYGMKLNPFKCAFGISAGKFLGFMVSQRGIEVSPDQVKTEESYEESWAKLRIQLPRVNLDCKEKKQRESAIKPILDDSRSSHFWSTF